MCDLLLELLFLEAFVILSFPAGCRKFGMSGLSDSHVCFAPFHKKCRVMKFHHISITIECFCSVGTSYRILVFLGQINDGGG